MLRKEKKAKLLNQDIFDTGGLLEEICTLGLAGLCSLLFSNQDLIIFLHCLHTLTQDVPKDPKPPQQTHPSIRSIKA